MLSLLLLESLLEADVDRLCKNSEYRVATLVSDPRVAPVPPPVRIRSLSVSLDNEGGVGSAVLDMVGNRVELWAHRVARDKILFVLGVFNN